MTEEKRIKIVLIGESGVGKTNLISVAMGNPFQKDVEPTISSSYYEGNIIVNNKQYNYSLWDTAGREAYRSLNKMFINGSKIVLVVFAINSRESYKEVDFWVNYAKETLGQKKYVLALVGNKSDLYEEQQVPDDEIFKKGEEINAKVKITSAAEDAVGFRQFLDQLLKEYITKIGFEKDDAQTFSLDAEKEEENKDGNNDANVDIKNKKKCC